MDWIREKTPSSSLPPILSRLVLQCELRRPEGQRPKRNLLRFGRCILIRYDCRTARLRTGSTPRPLWEQAERLSSVVAKSGSNKFGALRWGLRCRLLPNDVFRCSW